MSEQRTETDLLLEAKADGVREAADNLYLSGPGQHNAGAREWLHRRANLIDPRTRESVCDHGNLRSTACGYCATDMNSPTGSTTGGDPR